jgi:hypothetical protein
MNKPITRSGRPLRFAPVGLALSLAAGILAAAVALPVNPSTALNAI